MGHSSSVPLGMAGTLQLGDYEIDLTVYGSGAQAKVVCGRHLVTQEKVAIKVFSLKTEQNSLCFENEARMLKLCHKAENVVEAKSCFCHKSFGFLVMPFFKQDLLGFVMDNGGLEESLAALIFQQICIATQGCHEACVAHLDIKPENILYDASSKRAYLCDFGNSHQFTRGQFVNIGRRGTLVYCSPEVKREGNAYDPVAADIWSLGILLHVIVAGFFPHSQGEKDMELYHQGYVNLRFIQGKASQQFFDLLTSILVINPADRPNINDILSHPWLVHHTKNKPTSLAGKFSRRFFSK